MKGNYIGITLEWIRAENDWRVGFLAFILRLLGFRYRGGSSGRKDGIDSMYLNTKKYEWVEVDPSPIKEEA